MKLFQITSLTMHSPILRLWKSLQERGVRHTLKTLLASKGFRSLVVGVIALVTLIGLFYAVENWRGARAWRQYKAKLEAAGKSLVFEKLAPSEVPDRENLGALPYWEKVFANARSTKKEGSDDSLDILAWPNEVKLPMLEQFETGERADFRPLVADIENKEWDPSLDSLPSEIAAMDRVEAAESLLALLAKHDGRYQYLKSEALARPYSRFPIEYENGFGIILPHLSKLKELSMVASLYTVAALQAGQSDEAFSHMQLLLRLSEIGGGEEPFLISQYVRMAIVEMALGALWEGLRGDAWSEKQIQEIEAQLGNMDYLKCYELALRSERAAGIQRIEYLRRTRDFPFYESSMRRNFICKAMYRYAPNGWFHQNKRRLAYFSEEYELRIVDKEARRVFAEKAEEISQLWLEYFSGNSPYGFVVSDVTGAFSPNRFAHVQTRVNQARIACALEMYRRQNRQLPENLDALVDKYLNRVPHDVMTGTALHYECVANDKYRLYSVGWDQTDQGGKQDKDPSKEDWVWYGK